MKTINWKRLNGEQVASKVSHHISYQDMCAIAIAVKDEVFKGGIYRPYRRELDFVWHILLHYTDILFDDVDEMMEEYQYGELWSAVKRGVDSRQLDVISNMVDDMIDYERNKTGMDRLAALVTGFLVNEMRQEQEEENK